MKARLTFIMLIGLTLISCTRAPLTERGKAFRVSTTALALSDDLPLEDLISAIRTETTHPGYASAKKFTFADRSVSRADYLLGLDHFATLLSKTGSRESAMKQVQEDFDFFEVYGDTDWGKVLLTSYYEPEIAGSLTMTEKKNHALLKTPDDLVTVALSLFDERFGDLGQMRGRLVSRGPDSKEQLVPYYTREEIDDKNALGGKGLELCWVDPVDAFFLQIQGSGTVLLEDGTRFRVGYADQNGHRYQSIGKYLTATIPLASMSSQKIETHLKNLPPEESRKIMAQNPSYVFFKKREGIAVTSSGAPVVPGRTIATDARFFQKGTLAFLSFERPIFKGTSQTPESWEKTSRFVLDQDVGGAIRGGGRVDLFWGTGDIAKQSAGVIKQSAQLRYLVPKDSLLARLRASSPVP